MGNVSLDPLYKFDYPAWKALQGDGSLLGELAEAADLTVDAFLLSDFALVAGAGLAGYWLGQKIMQSINPDTPNVPPLRYAFHGGQANTNYRVFYTYQVAPNPPVSTSIDIMGPVQGLGSEGFGADETRWFLVNAASQFVYLLAAPSSQVEVEPTITDIQRLDGQPDTGNPAPDVARGPIPSQPLTRPTTIPIPGQTPDFPITPTVIPVPPSTDPNTDEPRQAGPIVAIPEAGLQVQYGPNGVAVVPYTPPATTTQAPPIKSPPALKVPVAPLDCPCPEPDLTKVICKLDYLEKYATDQGVSFTQVEGITGNNGRLVTDPEHVASVQFLVVQKPSNYKYQWGGGNAPDKVYVGWMSFLVDGVEVKQEPIQYAEQLLIAPQYCNGYSFTCYQGFQVTSFWNRIIRDSPSDSC